MTLENLFRGTTEENQIIQNFNKHLSDVCVDDVKPNFVKMSKLTDFYDEFNFMWERCIDG